MLVDSASGILSRLCCTKSVKGIKASFFPQGSHQMKNGQCPKCSSHEVFCNTNRKFPSLNTITVGSGTSGDRYVPLDTYICGTCGYVESYVSRPSDLSYIKNEWTLLEVPTSYTHSTEKHPVTANGAFSSEG